ncbi:MAG TPA: hypothetical protein VMX97_18315 [Hyphomicrobiaceae bacterium]|nr:hypothetical protein [Hyphomicrobiaceae bacterium]
MWLDETTRQSWISRDAIKLSVLFMRYITEPQDECLAIGRVERICQLDRDQVFETLRQMQLYGAVEAYTCHRDELHVSLNLTLLQRLRVLETRQRFIEQLTRAQHDRPLPARWKTNRWRPARSRTLMDAGDNVEQSG